MRKIFSIITVLILGVSSCSNHNNSSKLDSDEFESVEQRIQALKKEIIPASDFKNAEFELFNVNGFSNSRTTVPGASSVDYKFVVKVKTSDIDKWTKEMDKIKSLEGDQNWMTEIVKNRSAEWLTESQPEFYKRKDENVQLIVFRTEGIVFKRVLAN